MKGTRWLVALALASVCGAAAPAAAKDVCVLDSFSGAIHFKKPKSMKKPGSIVQLSGVLVSPPAAPTFVAPVVGTAVTRADSSILVGIFVLGQGVPPSAQTGSASLVVDQTLTGSGFRDIDGDFVQSDAITWTPVDCDTVALP